MEELVKLPIRFFRQGRQSICIESAMGPLRILPQSAAEWPPVTERSFGSPCSKGATFCQVAWVSALYIDYLAVRLKTADEINGDLADLSPLTQCSQTCPIPV